MVTQTMMMHEPPHYKTNKVACAPSETDQPGYSPSLISLRCPCEESLGPWLLQPFQMIQSLQPLVTFSREDSIRCHTRKMMTRIP